MKIFRKGSGDSLSRANYTGKYIRESALHSLGNIRHYLNDVECVMDMNRAVFLDRDGVITQDPPHYAHRIDQLALIEGSGLAIKELNDANFKIWRATFE